MTPPKEKEVIPHYMLTHFDEDKLHFDKLTELATQNGEHLSYFNKNLEEVKKILIEQNETNARQNQVYINDRRRIEPMLLAYEKDVAFNTELGEKGKRWGVKLGLLATAIGSWYVIKEFIIANLK